MRYLKKIFRDVLTPNIILAAALSGLTDILNVQISLSVKSFNIHG